MAMIKCPECGKEISDRAKKCPNCGFPIKKNRKFTNKKPIAIAALSVIAVISIVLVVLFVATSKERNYNKSVELYNAGNYSESLNKFKKISEYKDSAWYISKCEYELTVDGQFLRSLAKGLEKRWELTDADAADNKNMTSEQWKEFFDAEYNELKDFANKTFNDKNLGEKANKYIELLKQAKELTKYYMSNQSLFFNQYDSIFEKRCVILKEISDNYTIPLSEKNKTVINDLIAKGEESIAINKIIEHTKFSKKYDGDFGTTIYEAVVENTSNIEFEFFYYNISLVDKNGVVVQNCTPQTENWKPGSKNKFTFETNQVFEKIEIDGCEYN